MRVWVAIVCLYNLCTSSGAKPKLSANNYSFRSVESFLTNCSPFSFVANLQAPLSVCTVLESNVLISTLCRIHYVIAIAIPLECLSSLDFIVLSLVHTMLILVHGQQFTVFVLTCSGKVVLTCLHKECCPLLRR